MGKAIIILEYVTVFKTNKNLPYDMYVYVSVYKEKSGKPYRRSSTLLTNRRGENVATFSWNFRVTVLLLEFLLDLTGKKMRGSK